MTGMPPFEYFADRIRQLARELQEYTREPANRLPLPIGLHVDLSDVNICEHCFETTIIGIFFLLLAKIKEYPNPHSDELVMVPMSTCEIQGERRVPVTVQFSKPPAHLPLTLILKNDR